MRTHVPSPMLAAASVIAAAALVLSATPAQAAEPLNPDPDVEPPRPPLPESGFTLGAHLGVGYPFLDAIPGELAALAATVGARLGYRFTRAFALYLDGTALMTANTYEALAFAVEGPQPPDPRRTFSAAAVGSIALALRPVSWFEISAAPALGIHGSALFGGKGHIAFPLRPGSGRLTLAPTVEVIGLAGSEWKQVALTGGLGIDW